MIEPLHARFLTIIRDSDRIGWGFYDGIVEVSAEILEAEWQAQEIGPGKDALARSRTHSIAGFCARNALATRPLLDALGPDRLFER